MPLKALRTCFVLLYLTVAALTPLSAQTNKATLSGIVTDNNGEPLALASITVAQSKLGTKCDENGKYILKNVSFGRHSITISAVGFQDLMQTINVSGNTTLNFTLAATTNSLTEVTTVGKTEAKKIKEQPFTVTSIEMAAFKNLNLDINAVLNRAAGVRIRQMGGLGSDFSITLNGMSSLRIFIDGVPADGFGSSMSFNNFPINIIERIDIYKGATPVFLGGDVLGGAINIITKKENMKYIDASYGYSSFNTHQASATGRFIHKNQFAFNVNGFYNYSDNNYRIPVKMPDPQTYVVKDTSLIRPHNAYRSAGLTAEAGFVQKPWADRLMIGANIATNKNELQGYSMTNQPLQHAFRQEISVSPSIKYYKSNLFTKGLDLQVSGIYNYVQSDFVDTVSRTYKWNGTYDTLPRDQMRAETGAKSLLGSKNYTAVTTATTSYKISDQHSLVLNYNWNSFKSKTTDPFRKGTPPPPDYINKHVGGLSYQLSLFKKRWITNVFGKLYYMKTDVHLYETNGDITAISSDFFFPGRGVASTYFLGDFQFKASYEYAATLPQAHQIIGDRALTKPNPNLQPEVSHNINVGATYSKQINSSYILADVEYFFRDPKDFILLKSLGLASQYQNVPAVNIKGVGGNVRYSYKDRFLTELSGTYQDMRHDRKYTTTGNPDPLYDARIPNTPYLFGNFNAGWFTKTMGKTKWRAGVNYNLSYVNEYFLTWETQGDPSTKQVIPTQTSHDLSFIYSFYNGKYNFTVGCQNIFDTQLFDNFLVPRPGRSFNIKARVNINK